jgi:flagellar hook assembly protein FlgD
MYPEAYTATTVGAEGQAANLGANAVDLSMTPASAGINQVVENGGYMIVDYWMTPAGRQDVSVLNSAGQVVDRLKAGPAPADGKEQAPWRPPLAKGADALGSTQTYSFAVRNVVDTPQGMQISEAVVPIPRDANARARQGEAPGATPPISDLCLSGMSVLGDVLTVRAAVPPTVSGQEPAPPALDVRIANEAGQVVRQFMPPPPVPGKDYVFVWDCTDQAGKRVPDGRYLLQAGIRVKAQGGTARSEVRYWVDVPLEQTAKRLAILGPTSALPIQVRLDQTAGDKLAFTYVLPIGGRATVKVVDADGRVVRRLLSRDLTDGPHPIVWDACDDQGRRVSPGAYTLEFELDAGDRGGWGSVSVDLPAPK